MVAVVGKSQEHIKECTCRNCSSRLQYTLSEVQSHHYRDYDGTGDTDYFIVCPSCAKRVMVKNY